MTPKYRPRCSPTVHAVWALKQLALFVVPCLVLAASGALVARLLAPTEIKLYAPDE